MTSLDRRAWMVMVLLALQFGLQPSLTRRYASGPSRSTILVVQEVTKGCLAFGMLVISGERKNAFKNWTLASWLRVAVLPAVLYAIQNMCALSAYQSLDALTFNVLNQTKTLSAALNCYLLLGRKQSSVQLVALVLLLCSALVMEGILSGASSDQHHSQHLTHGVLPILLASYLSGLAGALAQHNLQDRNSFLFSLELCVASTISVVLSLMVSNDGQVIAEKGFWDQWETSTMIPIVLNASGGILVGLVTKYAGSVRKGFALIFGMFLSGLLPNEQGVIDLQQRQVAGALLAAVALYLHATYPPQVKTKVE